MSLVSCCYSKFGCTEQVKIDGLKQHEMSCPYRFVEENSKLKKSEPDYKDSLWDKFNEIINRMRYFLYIYIYS